MARHWSEEDDRRLLELWGRWEEASEVLGRSVNAVLARTRALKNYRVTEKYGVEPNVGPIWTKEDDEALSDLWWTIQRDPNSRAMVAGTLGRTVGAIEARAMRIGLNDEISRPFSYARYWQHKYLADRGYSAQQIVEILGGNQWVVYDLLNRLGSTMKHPTREMRFPRLSRCTVCDTPPHRLGLCRLHYRRLLGGQPLHEPKGTRRMRESTAELTSRVANLRETGLTWREIGEILGKSESRVQEIGKNAGFTGAVEKPKKHGIPARWQEGCRCDECMTAMNEYKRLEHAKAAQKAANALEAGGHLPGQACPCDQCQAVKAKQLRERNGRTQLSATNNGKPWSGDEDEYILTSTERIEDKAATLGRTYAAVDNRLRALHKMGQQID
ncbi:hypothetical protein [Psychromicrobium lacuslunae]|uniref:Uncharacterized protein n=1 Tax=Psychromicrobium lacuslunae TaxID=1618207 RepID=A0A0D4C1J0_9MICC|nr:hypothetical protein [Psychromicrobium lacuslunae]AJT42429.1 hypothetical protein UM93_14670 [Psychromicrobium lacuslunae]